MVDLIFFQIAIGVGGVALGAIKLGHTYITNDHRVDDKLGWILIGIGLIALISILFYR